MEPSEPGSELLELMRGGFKPVIYRNEVGTVYIRPEPREVRHGLATVVLALVARSLIVVDKGIPDILDENGIRVHGWTRYRLP